MLDQILGEFRRFHPLVGFGTLAERLEKTLNHEHAGKLGGLWAMLLMVWPWVFIVGGVSFFLLNFSFSLWPLFIFDVTVLYFALGLKSLRRHTLVVHEALDAGDLKEARKRVSYLVSRKVGGLDEMGVTKAALESLLENGSDAVAASLFWYAVAGSPGVVLHRLVNTLDAMWGYKSERFFRFGWAAARLDDFLGHLPARLCAFSYALASPGRFFQALSCWKTQAPLWKSPNAGPVMAAGAGALGVQLGGGAEYKTGFEKRPPLGAGGEPRSDDIVRGNALLMRAVLICTVFCALLSFWPLLRLALPQ